VVNRLTDLSARLASLTDTPDLDAQVLLAHVLGKPCAWLLAHPEMTLTPKQERALEKALRQLEDGVPLPYVLGKWEFYGLEFEVTPQVLIPRPETELLVERALHWLKQGSGGCGAWSVERGGWRILDVGTGSGCIAIALAVNMPELRVEATDISPEAIDVAKRNAKKFCVLNRIKFLCCNLFPTAGSFDFRPFGSLRASLSTFNMIVANLPYIPKETLHNLPVYGREPTIALDGGADGLGVIRRLLAEAPRHLTPGGLILLEIEASQGAKVLSLAHDAFAEAEIHLHRDLYGHDRLLEIQV